MNIIMIPVRYICAHTTNGDVHNIEVRKPKLNDLLRIYTIRYRLLRYYIEAIFAFAF
jgi:hypothetical protein